MRDWGCFTPTRVKSTGNLPEGRAFLVADKGGKGGAPASRHLQRSHQANELLTRFLRKYFYRRATVTPLADHGIKSPELQAESKPTAAGRNDDPWFWSHFDDAAGVILSLVPKEALVRGNAVMDFGCGDGITALGVASRVEASVVGLDIDQASFMQLPRFAKDNLGLETLPSNLSFKTNELDKAFPVAAESFDLVYSWSVCEHVSNITFALAEFHRILKPGGMLFIQIEPLYFSPFGSHLQRLVEEPWAHLLHDESEFLRLAEGAEDKVAPSEQDALYRTNAFADVKRYLIGEFRSLNRITAEDLVSSVLAAGFQVRMHKNFVVDLVPPAKLLLTHGKDLLVTNQVVLLAQKSH